MKLEKKLQVQTQKRIYDYKNIFLDRDGVINEVIIRDSIVSSPRSMSEFIIRDDFHQFISNLETERHKFFVVTNQPDISRNLLDIDDLNKMHEMIYTLFPIVEIVFCGHDDINNCSCRKPKPGMINRIISDHSLKREECIMIGDSSKDIIAAERAGIDKIFLKTTYNQIHNTVDKVSKLVSLL